MLKKLNMLLIAFLFISLLPLQAYAIDTVSTEEKPEEAEEITLRRDLNNNFKSIDYNITSTGATSGILYRTSKIKVEIGGYSGWIDSKDFMEHAVQPQPNQTIYNKISLDIFDIAQALINGGAIKDQL